ncbi:MAG: sarcosine oxidase subunit gamma [Rhodobacteraceae bacterium]|nr:sarcosine oxidase subunit gamma [Paracoccaceae bacterium]
MSELRPITALGADAPRRDTIGTVTITEVDDRAIASVASRAGKGKAFEKAAKTLFGIAPPQPGRWDGGADYALIWTGPDQWFAEAPLATHEDIATLIKAGLGDTASVTEQTGGWCAFELSGGAVGAVMERLVPVDAARMQAGHATRSFAEHMGVIVICREAGRRFTLMAPRSFAGSLHHALGAVARSVA